MACSEERQGQTPASWRRLCHQRVRELGEEHGATFAAEAYIESAEEMEGTRYWWELIPSFDILRSDFLEALEFGLGE